MPTSSNRMFSYVRRFKRGFEKGFLMLLDVFGKCSFAVGGDTTPGQFLQFPSKFR